MRRDSFKNVRFGGVGSRASSKSSSPKTVVHSTPPINPYKDIQQSFPSFSLYLYYDFVLLWIFLVVLGHILGQMYLTYGQKIWIWDGLAIITAVCCVTNEIISILSIRTYISQNQRIRSWKQAIFRSQWLIMLNLLLVSTSGLSLIFNFNRTKLARGAVSVITFNSSMLLSWVGSSTLVNLSKSTVKIRNDKDFLIWKDDEQTIVTFLASIFLQAFWQSMKLCIYCIIPLMTFLRLEEHHISYDPVLIFLHGSLVLISIFPFMLLYYYEYNRSSFVSRIQSYKRQQGRKQTQNWIMKFLEAFIDRELKSLQCYPGKHSFASLICSALFCSWILCEVIWLLISFHRRMNRLLTFEILLHLGIMYGFHFVYSQVPSFIRRSFDGNGGTTGGLHVSHQHVMVGEHDRNLKILISQQLSEKQMHDRYQDYQQRTEELEDSKAVEINQQRLQHQSSSGGGAVDSPNMNNRQRTSQRIQQHAMTQLNTELNGSKIEINR